MVQGSSTEKSTVAPHRCGDIIPENLHFNVALYGSIVTGNHGWDPHLSVSLPNGALGSSFMNTCSPRWIDSSLVENGAYPGPNEQDDVQKPKPS